jgi:hypothetical protein
VCEQGQIDMTTQHKRTEETKAKITRIFGSEYIFLGEYPIDEVASIIIERDIAPEPDRVRQFIESGEDPMTPYLNPYLEELEDDTEPPIRITEPRIIDCAVVLAADPVYAASVRADFRVDPSETRIGRSRYAPVSGGCCEIPGVIQRLLAEKLVELNVDELRVIESRLAESPIYCNQHADRALANRPHELHRLDRAFDQRAGLAPGTRPPRGIDFIPIFEFG